MRQSGFYRRIHVLLASFLMNTDNFRGFAGLIERILSVVLMRLPPMIRSYSRPSCPRTFSIAERILRTFST